MFDHHHYVPILLAKRGERRGVGDLDPATKSSLTPMFVIPPEDTDDLDGRLANTCTGVMQCWGSDRAFIDPYFVDDAQRMASGQHPLSFILDHTNAAGGTLVPTVATTRDADYRAAVASIAARDGRGACVRLEVDEWPAGAGVQALDDLLKDVGLTPAEVDLILDVSSEVAGATRVVTTAVRAELMALPYVADWRSITVAGAGFPPALQNLARGLSLLERADWTAYRDAVTGAPLPRIPTFGDYGIAFPDPSTDIDPRVMMISATFRYTVDAAWLLAKGELYKGRAGTSLGGAAMLPVAQLLTADARFAGASHCAGDKWLADTAAGTTSGGNPEAWRRAGTTHHLTHLVAEIASLHGSSGGVAP